MDKPRPFPRQAKFKPSDFIAIDWGNQQAPVKQRILVRRSAAPSPYVSRRRPMSLDRLRAAAVAALVLFAAACADDTPTEATASAEDAGPSAAAMTTTHETICRNGSGHQRRGHRRGRARGLLRQPRGRGLEPAHRQAHAHRRRRLGTRQRPGHQPPGAHRRAAHGRRRVALPHAVDDDGGQHGAERDAHGVGAHRAGGGTASPSTRASWTPRTTG
jgi:hypothetical protein